MSNGQSVDHGSDRGSLRPAESVSGSVGAILVLGDWVVDEYWFLVRHQSDISSNIGLAHYRISTEPQEVVVSLCGAGHLARILCLLRESAPDPEVWGVGAWQPDDTEFLSHLVHPHNCPLAQTAFHQMRTRCDQHEDEFRVHLRPLRHSRNTVRVVRLYHQEGTHLEQLSRIDWEPKQPYLRAGGQDGRTARAYVLPDELPQTVSHVLVEDYLKGAVTPAIVTSVRDRYPDARWHIRTKNKEWSWLSLIRDRIDLLIVGPEITSLNKPWNSWLADDRLTAQGHDLLKALNEELDRVSETHNLIVLTPQHEIMATFAGKSHCVTAASAAERTPLTDIGWSSAVFGEVSWALINGQNIQDRNALLNIIQRALVLADSKGSIQLPKSTGISVKKPGPPAVIVSSWSEEEAAWDAAMKGIGILESGGKSYLDVWRASTNLRGYITCIPSKQVIVDHIGREIRGFANSQNRMNALSILIQADPGSGKTYLAQSLAKAFACEYLPFDITQMAHRDELIDLFDAVAARQAELVAKHEYDRPVLVFVDEINSRLDRDYAYGAFLAPLEGGFYVRQGRQVMLRPCVWLFAGTDIDQSQNAPGYKVTDFKSRMTIYEKIDLKSLAVPIGNNTAELKLLYEQARLEQVYIGISMIGRAYPDVRRVSQAVLLRFWRLDPAKSPARIIRKLVGSFRNVQHGVVTMENWGRRHEEVAKDFTDAYFPDGFNKKREREQGIEDELVELRFRAAEIDVVGGPELNE